ncbi:MAG: AAA family ATPase [Bacteroidota bacterium]
MKNIVGQTPTGKDFFQRPWLMDKIYRRLEAGDNLFLSAPRRAGKTSIMKYLEDQPRPGFFFLYLNTEDILTSRDFFKAIAEGLLESDRLRQMTKMLANAKGVFQQFFDTFSKIKVAELELEMVEQEGLSYKDALETLIKKINTTEQRLVIMLDEFPFTIEHIAKTSGAAAAVQFLRLNRNLRQEAGHGIQFMYTGSIGLATTASRLKATEALNDLNIVEIPPLEETEAAQLSRQLLDNYEVSYEETVIPYLLKKLKWLMPFFIQLLIQLLIDEAQYKGRTIDEDMVDKMLAKASSHRSNIHFESYYTRLDKALDEEEVTSARQILLRIAKEDSVAVGAFKALPNANAIIEILKVDGYIHQTNDAYFFNSPILQNWWKIFAAL